MLTWRWRRLLGCFRFIRGLYRCEGSFHLCSNLFLDIRAILSWLWRRRRNIRLALGWGWNTCSSSRFCYSLTRVVEHIAERTFWHFEWTLFCFDDETHKESEDVANEMKWNETKRNETKRNEMKWNEMKWNEMKWNEMKFCPSLSYYSALPRYWALYSYVS